MLHETNKNTLLTSFGFWEKKKKKFNNKKQKIGFFYKLIVFAICPWYLKWSANRNFAPDQEFSSVYQTLVGLTLTDQP